ncbi:hypothetical protein [Stutzerimonas chloritidismutans]|uniref:hypothetical protein n=1 Tax=Stutzerimonas chloritidismutans TaxID=203192 RepID=UPI0028A9A360|nr:hypothetical protein [Stutzerimonas chloritidismutans]
MKRLSRKQRLRYWRRQQRIIKQWHKERHVTPRPRKSELLAPEEFCLLNGSHHGVVDFFEKLRRACLKGGKVVIDFGKTKRFIADGTLLLYAEVDRLLDNVPNLKIRCRLPDNEKAAQVLQQIGFLKRIGVHIDLSCGQESDVINWRTARGQGALGEKYDSILGSYDGVITEALQGELYTGLTESMTNAHHHAYLAPRGDGLLTSSEYKPWWMFSQEKEGMLTVVFCDLGIGIPGSLPVNEDEGWAKWWRVMSRRGYDRQGDAMVIRGAVRHSRTRTMLLNRGKGLRQIIDTVSASKGGTAIIQSNKGWYRIAEGAETFGNHKQSIKGTVIFWRLPLPEAF